MTPAALTFALLASHAVCDFALQSDAMAKGKNRHNRTTPPPGAKYQPSWTHWLTAHAMIHGAGVALVTGIWWLGALEAVCHWLIDFNKCDNRIGMNTDQGLHLACKVAWLAIALWVGQ
jgi:hypothetical protein